MYCCKIKIILCKLIVLYGRNIDTIVRYYYCRKIKIMLCKLILLYDTGIITAEKSKYLYVH